MIKHNHKAFTLIELLISIMILSILMLFLYKSYAGLNISNVFFSKEVKKLASLELVKKTLFVDFTLALDKNVTILNQARDEDVVYLHSSNSVHNRINPYIAYLVKDKKLYRLESLKPFKEYPMTADSEFVTDELGIVKIFRVYPSQDRGKGLFFIHVLYENTNEILLKVGVSTL